jgi:glycosyltransferase involved in cell wall biosynthesis
VNLVASLIVKNELGRYLKPCIAHLREFCDLIAVVDDGSTDGSAEWLLEQGDEQLHVLARDAKDGFFAGHEGHRRNELLKWTFQLRPDWVLAIDADEFIADGQKLRDYMGTPRPVGTVTMEEVWKVQTRELSVRADGGWRPHDIPIFYRASGRRFGGRWVIPNRELACGREPMAVRREWGKARKTETEILHFGWAASDPEKRRPRYDRYVTADGGKFHRNSHLDSIMWPDADVKLLPRGWPTALLPYRAAILKGVK